MFNRKKKNEADKQKNGGTGKNGKPRKRAGRLGLFIKTFFISTVIIVVLVFSGGLYYLANWISPPEIDINSIPDENGYYVDGVWHGIAPVLPDSAYTDGSISGELIDGNTAGYETRGRKPDFYTFLIFGLDDGNFNTDTIMVASYDGIAKEANIISLPRDTLVNVRRTVKKINAAYGAGTLNGGGHEGGVMQFKREISTIIGFVPDYYVCINLKAFERIIDAVGGIDVYNPYNMVYDDPWQNLHINIPAGNRHLNGS